VDTFLFNIVIMSNIHRDACLKLMSAEVACATRGNHCFARRNAGANREKHHPSRRTLPVRVRQL